MACLCRRSGLNVCCRTGPVLIMRILETTPLLLHSCMSCMAQGIITELGKCCCCFLCQVCGANSQHCDRHQQRNGGNAMQRQPAPCTFNIISRRCLLQQLERAIGMRHCCG